MMKALVVVFPTSSLSNTMPSCRICRHKDFLQRDILRNTSTRRRQQTATCYHTPKGMELHGPTLASLCRFNSTDIVL